ncbi:hypothetical protein [Lysobacter capsici]|uniref:hypothetical protein n=1 Tax=Lysobacter capsici TaxID=435897 RepID=UPI00287B638C|nr:hypothetical protein [Lysobacter capsici]WND82020.1 hypothetical protein RJ610_06570 [Lysobacter capsici]WND87216.1 hypothetical protein RJ609_06575 [Lysobacter capsici]
MSIDRLSTTASLIAALRSELSRKTERVGGKNMPASEETPPPARAGKRDLAALRRDLAELLKDVPAGDAEALDAARPHVIRTILLWEFGSELREHSQWQPMLDSLVETLQADDSHRQAMSRLLSELRV